MEFFLLVESGSEEPAYLVLFPRLVVTRTVQHHRKVQRSVFQTGEQLGQQVLRLTPEAQRTRAKVLSKNWWSTVLFEHIPTGTDLGVTIRQTWHELRHMECCGFLFHRSTQSKRTESGLEKFLISVEVEILFKNIPRASSSSARRLWQVAAKIEPDLTRTFDGTVSRQSVSEQTSGEASDTQVCHSLTCCVTRKLCGCGLSRKW